MSSETRLNKFIALHMGVSRREADGMIEKGRVRIDGEVPPIGARVTDHSEVVIDGKKITKKSGFTTLLLKKPVGYVCSRKRQGDSPTIYELLPPEYQSLKTVGRRSSRSR